jgi:penicillin-binding protein 2
MNEQLKDRRWIVAIAIGALALVFVVRLFYLQVLSPDYAASADRNVIKREVIAPTRGVVYDRHGKIFVTVAPVYDLKVVPNELKLTDTSALERFLGVDRPELRKRLAAARKYNANKPTVLERQISAEAFAGLQEHLWSSKGLYAEVRNKRDYLYPIGANFMGYISEVNKRDIERSKGYYDQGDVIGTSGLERQYEQLLRGQKGVKLTLVDVLGREVGSFSNGAFDTTAQKGADVRLTIDADLQQLAEALMVNKIGSIVAIEPSSGDILAFVSAPTYDPSRLTGQATSTNWKQLNADSLLPLFNRPLMAMYPPGSIFKILNGITALSAGTISEHTLYGCAGGFGRNGGRPKCHAHPSPLNLEGAIQHSCNAYFAATYVDMLHSGKFDSFNEAYLYWRETMSRYGVGHRIGVDIPNEKPGNLPSDNYYNKIYGKNRWFGMTIVSNAIGQGEVLMTPLQMANVTATLANRGYYVQPHFFRGRMPDNASSLARYDTIRVEANPRHYEVVVNGMEKVVSSGTGFLARVPNVVVCGKTGTAENPHGEDHSVFIAFAPKDNPKIALAVVIENAGFGGVWAAPVARLMIEQYLAGEITDRWALQRILDADFIKRKAPAEEQARLNLLREKALAYYKGPAIPVASLAAKPAQRDTLRIQRMPAMVPAAAPTSTSPSGTDLRN